MQPPAAATTEEATDAPPAPARLNIPFNLDNWKALPAELVEKLAWFHQHALDQGISLKECGQALGYDGSVVFRALKGTYEGNWENVAGSISSYRRVAELRGKIQRQTFVENSITRLIFSGLDYALANNSITLIEGESRLGKTASATAWRERDNRGRSVFIIAPARGDMRGLLRDISSAIGSNKELNIAQMHEAILRAFNKNRILIVDEAHRLLPSDRRSNPVSLEILRDIHDRTGCALALLATSRFLNELKKGEYMFEQLLGRIGMPIRLPRKIKPSDVEPIVRQFIARPGVKLMAAAEEIANAQGRLGLLVETLKLSSKLATKEQKTDKPRISEEHFLKAVALRKQISGELFYAAK